MADSLFDASFWDKRYAGKEFVYGTEPNEFLASVADQFPDGPILGLGEGEGRNVVHLAGLGHAVTAVDQSTNALAKAQTLAQVRGVRLETQVADLSTFEIRPDAWAGVICMFVHLPPILRRKVFAAVVRGLKSGGLFVLEAYGPDQMKYDTGGPKDLSLLMKADDLRQELAGLEFPILREIERDITEGNAHTGRSAVTQILARKP